MKTIVKTFFALLILIVVAGYFLRPVSSSFRVVAFGSAFTVEAYTFPLIVNRERVALEVEEKIHQLDRDFSPWMRGSVLVELNKSRGKAPVKVDKVLFAFFQKVVDLYIGAKLEGDPFGLAGLKLNVDTSEISVIGEKQISLNLFESSIVIDRIVDVLAQNGVHSAMVKGPSGLSVVVGRKIYEEFEGVHNFSKANGYSKILFKKAGAISVKRNSLIRAESSYQLQLINYMTRGLPEDKWRAFLDASESVDYYFVNKSNNLVKSPNLLNFLTISPFK